MACVPQTQRQRLQTSYMKVLSRNAPETVANMPVPQRQSVGFRLQHTDRIRQGDLLTIQKLSTYVRKAFSEAAVTEASAALGL